MPLVDAVLRYQYQSYSVRILMDSGAAGNFISSRTLAGFKIPRCKNDTTYQITTVQGKPLGRGLVRSHTPEVSLHIGCFHEERISLLVLEEAVVDVVLGRPWLAKHQPTIDWRSGEILKWDSGCKQRCLRDLPVPVSNNASLSIFSTTIESPETCQVSHVPPEYQSFKDVFSKEAATHLPPHLTMGLLHWPAAWGQATQRTYLPIVDLGENRHGGVHKGGFKSGVHPSVHLTRSVNLLLRGQEGWRSEALHRLPCSKRPDGKVRLSPSSGSRCPGGAPRVLYLQQARFKECL